MTLHLVFSTAGWLACKDRMADDDAVVLLGDGVYAPERHDTGAARLLGEDLSIRGLSAPAGATTIDYAELVELTARHCPIVSWQDG